MRHIKRFRCSACCRLAGCNRTDRPNRTRAATGCVVCGHASRRGQANRFIDLYTKLAADKSNKGRTSSFAVQRHTAAAMTATGAKGNTRDQMVKALHLQKTRCSPPATSVRSRPPRGRTSSCRSRTRLWGQKGFPWRGWLKEQNGDSDQGSAKPTKANPDAEPNASTSGWRKTRDRIKELLQREQISKTPRWCSPTRSISREMGDAVRSKDQERAFKCDDGTTVEVPMMMTRTRFIVLLTSMVLRWWNCRIRAMSCRWSWCCPSNPRNCRVEG